MDARLQKGAEAAQLRRVITDTHAAEAALDALCVRLATLRAEDGALMWRSGGFEAALPGLRHLQGAGDGVEGLIEAFEDCRLSGRPISALVSVKARKAVYDARLHPSADGRSIHVELQDAAERRTDERRRLEDRERLLLTSRVLSVGEMASLVAHELNQPIGAVVNLLRGLKAKLVRGTLTVEAGSAAIDRGVEQALYASGVIARIRSFVDQRQPQVTTLDLAKLARDTLGLLDWEIQRDGVETDIRVPPDLPPVLGDAVMIQQVLVNIARNGVEAMRRIPGERLLRLEAAAGVREVEMRIVDSGPGMDEATAQRIFQPFYSTKSDGMGVGLGVCRSVVELHGGRLWRTSPEGGGSAFHMALPRAPVEHAAA